MRIPIATLSIFVFLNGVLVTRAADSHPTPDTISEFINQYCTDCHDDDVSKEDLNLSSLSAKPISLQNLETWIKVHERAAAGEMPPKKKPRPDASHLNAFLKVLSQAISQSERKALAESGRSVKRRLNRYEYENTLRDLLALPYLEIKESLPEDATAHGFNKVGEALDVSHVQIARYLQVAEYALREAIAPQVELPKKTNERYYTWQHRSFVRSAGPTLRKTFPIVGLELQRDFVVRRDPVTKRRTRPDLAAESRPERVEREAVVMLMSTYEPAEIKFDLFRAPVAGRYRLRFSGYTVWMAPDFSEVSQGRRTEPITIYSETPPRRLRRLGAFDFSPDPSVHELVVWLKAGESIQPDAARLVRSRPPNFKNPYLEPDGMPGVAFQWMEVEGPLFEEWPQAGHKLLFGDLPITDPEKNEEKSDALSHVSVTSSAPAADAERLVRHFLGRAYRHPVAEKDVQRFLDLILRSLEKGHGFTDAMVAGYTAVLASPGFIYLSPSRGRLGAHALAERLSYFLWNSAPDDELRQLVSSAAILDSETLSKQVERLLDDPRARRFVDAFLAYWLDLRLMAENGPDAELYPEYQLDDMLTESMPTETQLFFAQLIKRNLGVRNIVASDFIIINERLATLYGIVNVWGTHFRPVRLPADSVRGGLMTQASVLKVTANGTTTSPVTRGVWIMERILGHETPPPPPSVPAIESDIRGATTIRAQLALHRSQASCNACHRRFDPAGFALESFDVMGGYRDRYRSAGKGQGDPVKGFGHDGQTFRYRLSLPVDASGELQLSDTQAFQDIRTFKRLLLAHEEQLARNLTQQLAVYATGAPIRFSDGSHIEAILRRSRPSGYGVRRLIHELVQSDIFLAK
ncbi:MAG: DUF1592 domain-containing protein [Planctomycetes bacterium]|nr:DUF1592 domain-containing protein [Planctomycetota bacterium]